MMPHPEEERTSKERGSAVTCDIGKILRDPVRLDALHGLRLLDTPAEESFDRLSKLAAAMTATPVALVTLLDFDRQFFKSCFGLPQPWSTWRQTPLSHSFCQHVVATGKPLVIEDARLDAGLKENLAIPDLNIVAYLGVPLMAAGQVIGSFCVLDRIPRKWTPQQIDAVRDLAELVMTELKLRGEIVRRCETEDVLRENQAELEQRVRERTAELEAELLERKKLETRLLHAQKMDALGRLSGGIAHDFNNLLTAIVGYADLAESNLGDAKAAASHLAEVRSATGRAAELTKRLLAFARKQATEPKVFDLNELVTGMQKMLARVIGEDVRLTTRLEPSPWMVSVDPGQMEQVLMNLVINARDAMPRGGNLAIETANVTLDERAAHAISDSAPGEYVRLAVRDTGSGMSAEVRRLAFEPFFTTKEQGRGTGLGLATSYGVVRQAHGSIRIDSEPGVGTSVTIYLPRAAKPRPEPAAPAAAPAGGGSETVLVAEDETLVRMLAVHTLRSNGYTVLEAGDGAEALRVAQHHAGTIDLLLTDMVMPRIGGVTLAQRLREQRPGLRVVFSSGYSSQALSEAGLTDAAVLLPKPYRAANLLGKVREALAR
jgi:signal transduction histidine kinase